MVFDVWTSQKAFDKFGKTLMPILQRLGIDSAAPPTVMPIHKVIVPAPKTKAKPPAKASRLRR